MKQVLYGDQNHRITSNKGIASVEKNMNIEQSDIAGRNAKNEPTLDNLDISQKFKHSPRPIISLPGICP